MTNDIPMPPEFAAALEALAARDVVERSAPDPDAVARLREMVGHPVVLRDWELNDTGVRLIETEALLIGAYGN
jgi:hypothetical protein